MIVELILSKAAAARHGKTTNISSNPIELAADPDPVSLSVSLSIKYPRKKPAKLRIIDRIWTVRINLPW